MKLLPNFSPIPNPSELNISSLLLGLPEELSKEIKAFAFLGPNPDTNCKEFLK